MVLSYNISILVVVWVFAIRMRWCPHWIPIWPLFAFTARSSSHPDYGAGRSIVANAGVLLTQVQVIKAMATNALR